MRPVGIQKVTLQERQYRRIWPPAVILGLSVVGISVLSHFYKYPVEDLQTISFLLVLLVSWRLASVIGVRIPPMVIALIIGVYALSALHLRGLMPDALLAQGLYLGRLEDDAGLSRTREFYRKYNQRAEFGGYPPMRLLQRSFLDDKESLGWRNRHPSLFALIHGTPDWVHVMPSPLSAITKFEGARADLLLSKQAESYRLESEDGVTVPVSDLGISLLLVSPEYVLLPTDPMDVSHDFLGLLSAALAKSNEAEKRDALMVAALLEGHWKTFAPRAAAYLLAGALDLSLYAANAAEESARLECAENNFLKAESLVQKRFSPQIEAVALNNLGVALAFRAQKKDDWKGVRAYFLKASTIFADGRPVRGASAALVNLIMLERSGMSSLKYLRGERASDEKSTTERVKESPARIRRKALRDAGQLDQSQEHSPRGRRRGRRHRNQE